MNREFARIPPLISGGVMLSYRCTNACRHCLYRCSPRMPDEWMDGDRLRRTFAALRAEPDLVDIHIAGGEPTMKFDLLVDAIEGALSAGLRVSYVETNGHWCTTDDAALAGMRRLREAGLEAILVSASLFHNEFIPFASTRRCVEAAHATFGAGATLVYMSHMYRALSALDHHRRHTVEEFLEHAGLAGREEAIPQLYSVTPNGRAATALAGSFAARAADEFRDDRCLNDLSSTTHFHIDPYGNLFTGLCPGLATGTIDGLRPALSRGTAPVTWTLMHGGPAALMDIAVERHRFVPRKRGYVSKCDLCQDVRACMHATGEYEEIRPDCFYAGQE